MQRKNYIDNIRWMTVLLVVLYHLVYQFNSVGVVKNLGEPGIPAFDLLLPFVYPWFMCLMFVLAGISAYYALRKRTKKQFLKERFDKLLVPSIAGTFLFGWMTGWVTSHYGDMSFMMNDQTPGFLKYLIFCVIGQGPLWFAQELFLVSLILLLILLIDKKESLWKLGGKVNFIVLILLVLPLWGSSFLLNMPLITVFRTGIYLFCFLIGFYILSHDEILSVLKKYHLPLLVVALITGVIYVWVYRGANYSSDVVLKSFLTNFYAWAGILAILGCGQCWLDFENTFTKYMKKTNYPIFLIHMPFMVIIAYGVTRVAGIPILGDYILTLLLTIVAVIIGCEVISRIPVIRYLAFGIRKKKQ